MKHLYYTLFIPLMLCCCDKGSTCYPDESKECRLTALIESIHDCKTRSQIGNDGSFTWTGDDVIGICGYSSINHRFHYVAGSDSGNVFAGVFDSSRDSIRFGYYPFQDDISIRDGNLSFIIEENTAFHNNRNEAPMIGFVSTGNNILFRQTGGLLRLSFKGLRNEMKYVVVESAGDSRHYLSGEALLAIDPDGMETFCITSGSYNRRFDLSFMDKDTMVYDMSVPFQIGLYSCVKVCIIDENGDTLLSNSLSDVTMERASLITVPLLDCSN